MPTANTVAKVDKFVADALDKSGVETGTVLIVAVSGGPDSLALLHSLCRIVQRRDIRLHGAHLDHGLRGPASDADATFVAQTFERLCIPYTLEKADVAAKRRRENLSIEDAARRLRHGFFAQVAADQGTDTVALGHTIDDQAETVLLHLVRGAGLTGLRGMPQVLDMDVYGRNLVLLRPLLGVTRQETAEYCRRIGVEPCVDETNFSTRLTRNRIRLELLPLMEQINPAVKDSLVRLSRSVAVDLAFIEGEIDGVVDSTMSLADGVVSINREQFLALHPSIRNHLIRRAFLLVTNDMVDLRQSHVEEIGRLISGSVGTSLDLSGGIRFAVSYEVATLGPELQPPCPLPPLADATTIQVPGETHLSGWRITTRLAETKAPPPGGASDGSRFSQRFDLDSLGGRLALRARVPGDRFQPLGMAHAKKLQDFMVDGRIPREWRDNVPLLVTPRGIAWVVGWRVAHWARLREDTREALQVELESLISRDRSDEPT
ncbi:tRNA lysidine(34) synthetase TilS [Dehalococcoidia bacterium]|nr:tRNA lysidine(34) synthetase TilS [Dehalococcoidia bacterium]